MKFLFSSISSLAVAVFSTLCGAAPELLRIRKDEPQINKVDATIFPEHFLWGVANSEYQVSGSSHCPNSNWADWEKRGKIRNESLSGRATNFWENYLDQIEMMQELGVNSFRFSIEWSRVEPEEGLFDEEAIEHYREILVALKRAGIEPMVTLHHFTNPLWFEAKGAFEKEENIDDFVRFSRYIFEALGGESKLWCTINEPTVYVLMGYVIGQFPPGKYNICRGIEVLRNLLIAHCRVYKELKAMPFGDESEIGLAHNSMTFEAYYKWNLFESLPCRYLSRLMNDTVIDFLRDGKLEYYIPFLVDMHYEDLEAPGLYDFIGLNYYSRAVIKLYQGSCFDGEIMTDMPYAIYPEGFYEAIKECTLLGKPVYITENGIADQKDDRRELFIDSYIHALSKAVEEGHDVRGYFYWTLVDNFEWAEGWKMRFGLYALDTLTGEMALREGSKAFQRIIERWRLTHEEALTEIIAS